MSENNSIELITVAFAAGESRLFAMSGEYFEIIDAPSPVDVVLSDFSGAQRARMAQAAASFYSKGVQFGVIQITSASAQTVRFAYGSGETGTRRSTGSVTISGAVALDAATLAALEQINVRPEAPTASFNNQTAMAANTAQQVFSAASNVNGAILLGACLMSYAASTSQPSLVAKATTPTSVTDGDVLLLGGHDTNANRAFVQLSIPQFIPAGLGLFYITNVGETESFRTCRYKLL